MGTRAGRTFAPHHARDRDFFLAAALLLIAVFAAGFWLDIRHHLLKGEAPYAPIVGWHGVLFLSWLGLFATQVGLVRTKRLRLHRRFGWAVAGVAAAMIVLGATTAWIVDRAPRPGSGIEPAVLWLQAADLVAFGGFVAAGIALRGDPGAHKRLMLLGTIFMTDAAFTRLVEAPLHDAFAPLLGTSAFEFFLEVYLPTDLLVLAGGAYDWVTRRRLHPAWAAGAAVTVALQAVAIALFESPASRALASRLLT
jgi:hypothetical protein